MIEHGLLDPAGILHFVVLHFILHPFRIGYTLHYTLYIMMVSSKSILFGAKKNLELITFARHQDGFLRGTLGVCRAGLQAGSGAQSQVGRL